MIRVLLYICLCACITIVYAQQPNESQKDVVSQELRDKASKAIDRGVRYLRGQLIDGSHLGDPGLTSLALTAFMRCPRKYGPQDGPWIRNGLEFLAKHQKPDGGIYRDQLGSYNTSVAIMAFTSNPEAAKTYASHIQKGTQFLRNIQCDESEGYTPDKDIFYGGVGYGGSERPDLSNTQMALEALDAAGIPKDDPAYQKAIVFLQRCQNRSESNSLEWAGNDGGFVYYPGNSYAGTTTLSNGKIGLRSYGSMTYAGLKSYIHANLKPDDPRVQSAWDWIRKNYDLAENPNMGQQGLYYYYHTFAKTLALMQVDIIKDEEGVEHNWREDLIRTLLARQILEGPDAGSWKNVHPRWWEAEPRLVTSYAIICLSVCLEK